MEYRFRFLKNIMGMWLLQNIRRNLDKKYTYDEMMRVAMGSDYKKTFDCNDPTLTAPEHMLDAIQSLLGEKLPLPNGRRDRTAKATNLPMMQQNRRILPPQNRQANPSDHLDNTASEP